MTDLAFGLRHVVSSGRLVPSNIAHAGCLEIRSRQDQATTSCSCSRQLQISAGRARQQRSVQAAASTASDGESFEARLGPADEASASGSDAPDLAEHIDGRWGSLPLDEMRRPGEEAWDVDGYGPAGPEKFDNTFLKRQQALNATAIGSVGMGSWRLQALVSPLVRTLVANVEGACRHLLDDLALYPLPPAWRYADSLDPDGTYGSWSFQDLEPPPRGGAGWPRLQIESRCYRSRVFRKLHFEVAYRQDGLEVLHCVMYPWVTYDLPILSLDMVTNGGAASLAIVDPCPVSMDGSLPPAYVQACRTLQQEFGVENNREVPEWGRKIFSDQCVMMRPQSADGLAGFLKYAIALTRVHLRLARNAQPVETNRASRTQLISAAQRRYCEQQLLNSKTRRVLEAAFSHEFAEAYLTGLMFDSPATAGHGNSTGADAATESSGASSTGAAQVSADRRG